MRLIRKLKLLFGHKAARNIHATRNEQIMIKVMLARGCYADNRDLFKARGNIFK